MAKKARFEQLVAEYIAKADLASGSLNFSRLDSFSVEEHVADE